MATEMNDEDGWTLLFPHDDDPRMQVLPTTDSVPHSTEGEDCICGPRVETEGLIVPIVVHASLDGRELDE